MIYSIGASHGNWPGRSHDSAIVIGSPPEIARRSELYAEIPKHVVLATDLTLAADPAVTVSARFAKALKVDISLFHVFQYVPQHGYRVPVDWMVYELRRKVELKLD